MSKLSLVPENQQYFYPQYHDIKNNAVESTAGIFRFSNQNLREHMAKELCHDNAAGKGNYGLMGNPVFEVLFPWESQDKMMADFGGNVLHPKLANMLVDSIPVPYKHQAKAWEILNQKDKVNSLIVTSGTGSGKTECFMVPILDDLVKQQKLETKSLTGVRALFLYPLNALINSQRERLAEWSNALSDNGSKDITDKKIRFCLYNGDTPEYPKKGEKNDTAEVLSRQRLREDPPPILVTNATMLEYMLIRQNDTPIIDKSKGKLRWIVLDEAHSYTGSTAAELSLLLRRVMIAFDVDPKEVHFVATSATIGDDEEAQNKLKRFLASLAGVDSQQIHIVSASRDVPTIPTLSNTNSNKQLTLEELSHIDGDAIISPQRFEALVQHPFSQKVRQHFVQKTGQGTITKVRSLKDLAAYLKDDINSLLSTSNEKISHVDYLLNWLDVCANTKISANTPAFLPLRSHFFQRTLAGLYACVNPNCSGKNNTSLAGTYESGEPKWGFGYVYTNHQTSCTHCNFPVYELGYCDDCQTPHLLVQKDSIKVNELSKTKWAPFSRLKDDDFTLDRPTELDDDEQLDIDSVEEDEQITNFQPMLLLPVWASKHKLVDKVAADSASYLYPGTIDKEGIEYTSEYIELPGDRVDIVVKSEEAPLPPLNHCYFCDNQSLKKTVIRTARLGAPFYMGAAAPLLLEHCPAFEMDTDSKPAQGRRMITFTDSRQGTARITMKLRQDSERRSLRHIVYYNLAQQFRPSPKLTNEEQKELNSMKAVLEQPGLPEIAKKSIKDSIKALESKTIAQPPIQSWKEAVQSIADHPEFEFLSKSISKIAAINHINDDFQKAELLLLKEIAYRPKNANSLETMGLLSFYYPQLEDLKSNDLAEWNALGFNDEDWKDFLHLILTYYVREQRILDISENKIRSLNTRFFRVRSLVKPGAGLNLSNKDSKTIREWVQVNSKAPNNSMRIVRLLALAANLDLEKPENEDIINKILLKAWEDLTKSNLLTSKAIGGGNTVYQLNFNNAYVSIPQKVWVCPVTNRLLPKTLKQLTPYLPRQTKIKELTAHKEEYECREESINIFKPTPGETRFKAEAEEWIENNNTIQSLRRENLWSNLSSDVIRGVNTLVTEEHSAQLSSTHLKDYESKFKQGDINILNCSTTMEMGVDIGGITSVAMSNVPPHPANYLQRTGRAGRSRESTATAFTLCKDNPHEQMVFNNTLWAFDTQISPPYITLESTRIVQRHVNAYLLAHYLPGLIPSDAGQSTITLNTGLFFFYWKETSFDKIEGIVKDLIKKANTATAVNTGTHQPPTLVKYIDEALSIDFEEESELYKEVYYQLLQQSPAFTFVDKLRRITLNDRQSTDIISIEKSINSIRRFSALETISLTDIINNSILDLTKAQHYLINRVARRIVEYKEHDTSNKKDKGYLSKLIFDIRSIACGYLLSDLARHNFLPRYGFPSGLVEFDMYSLHAKNADQSNAKQSTGSDEAVNISLSTRDDNLSIHANKPVRDIAIAIREYAPGNEIAVDGLIYQSAGLELSRYYNSTESNDAQIINVFARCKSCGAMDVYPSAKNLKCHSCGASITSSPEDTDAANGNSKLKHDVVTYVEPMGFRVDYYSAPHSSIEHQSYVPVEDPKIQAKGDLKPLISSDIGTFRTDPDGLVFHQSSGVYGNGYFICLSCGRAESSRFSPQSHPEKWDEQRTNFLKHLPMKPISKGKVTKDELKSGACDPEQRGFLAQHLFIGAQDSTNVFEMYLKDPKTGAYLNTDDDKTTVQTLSVAFRDALAACHGINAEELGFGIKQIEIDKDIAYAISIYDKASGGAGFSSTAHQYLNDLFKKAKEILSCVDDCDTACHSCLLSYDTRFISHKLDRKKALDYLENIKNLIKLPEKASTLLPNASHGGEDIDTLVSQYLLRSFKHLTIYLQGDPKEWALSVLSSKVAHWTYNGINVDIALNPNDVSHLDDIAKLKLTHLTGFNNVTLYTFDSKGPYLDNNYLVQMAKDDSEIITIATTDKAAYIPNDGFWKVDKDENIVKSADAEPLSLQLFNTDLLVSDSQNDTKQFEISNELDGSLKDFGSKFWSLMRDYSKLDEQIKNKVEIKKIVYSDRYIKSPLTALLIGVIIHALKSMYDKQWSDPNVILKVEEAKNHLRRPRRVDHNWQDHKTQEKVITALYKDLGLVPVIGVYPYEGVAPENRAVKHRRYLEISWSDGSNTLITLDQGIGFMGISQESSSRIFDLDFDASPQHQAGKLVALSDMSSAKIKAVEGSHPAYISHTNKI